MMKHGVVFVGILVTLVVVEYLHKQAQDHERILRQVVQDRISVCAHRPKDHVVSVTGNAYETPHSFSYVHEYVDTLQKRLEEMSQSVISRDVLNAELEHIRNQITTMRSEVKQQQHTLETAPSSAHMQEKFIQLQQKIDALEDTYERKFKLLQKRMAQVLEEHLSTTHMLIKEEIKTMVDPIREKLHHLSRNVAGRSVPSPGSGDGVDRREISHMIRRSIQKNLRRLEDRHLFDEID